MATDAKGVIQIFNVGAGRMLGYAAADVIGKSRQPTFRSAELSDPAHLVARAKAIEVEIGFALAADFEALVFLRPREQARTA